ncbi:nucleoid-associated protein [Jeongeupia naejangsanensis]|uniref:Nucleoid-associated protein n=1 Tax=Jeongeupia naejangsanensis TaxID=613195 RepID=A0ABS2BQT7_9NEIS|nr:nucleoid-associated protein [Jeongeupia naejangsanensis]MBM3117413.1 nucleoid-associated protein [Jeongeupia naejangsanensis]
MSTADHVLRNFVVHHLIKAPQGPASMQLRDAEIPVSPAALQLVDQLVDRYSERSGKGFGRFEDDEDSFPMPRLLRQHVVDGAIDFLMLSRLMMQQLLASIEAEPLAAGGYVLIARVEHADNDYLFVALASEALGTAIGDGLSIVDSPYLDLANLRVAGRIDLSAWQRGVERCISFLKGRGDVANYFKRFLGCNDVVIALKETQKLVQGLAEFAERQAMPTETRDALFERAHGYLDERGDAGEPVSLDTLVEQAWPDAPGLLREALNDDESRIARDFVPDRRAIRPLTHFKAAADHWKIEFDRNSLRSGQVIYDRDNGTLILTEIPEGLRRALLGDRE